VGVKHGSLSRVSGSALPSAFIAFFYLAISIYIPNLILWQVTFVVHNYFWSGSLKHLVYIITALTWVRTTRDDTLRSTTSLIYSIQNPDIFKNCLLIL
jgi:hypothetical protein